MRITLHRFGSSVIRLDRNLKSVELLRKFTKSSKLAYVLMPSIDAVYRVNDNGQTRYIATRQGDHAWHEVNRMQAGKLAAGEKFEDVMGDKIEWTHAPAPRAPQPVRAEDIDLSGITEDQL